MADDAEENVEQEEPKEGAEEQGAEYLDDLHVVPFDFKHPNRLPKEQRKTITIIHETYAQTVAVALSAFLRSEVSISLTEVEQCTFHEYVMSLSNPTCVATYDMQPLSGYGVVEMNSVLVYGIIDKMLGGDGNPPPVARSFTDIERTITRKLLNILLNELSESWSHILTISFRFRDIHTNPAFIRVIPQRETCVVVNLKAQIGETSGMMTLCMPYMSLEPIAGKLRNDQYNRFQTKQSDALQAAHKRNFYRVPLDVEAVLGTAELSMAELLLLQAGDVLDLKKRTSEPIEIRIAGEPMFRANPGLIGRHKGVSIHSELTKE